MEFLYLRETALYLTIKHTETAPCLWSVCNLARKVAIETLTHKDGFKTASLDLLEMLLVNGYVTDRRSIDTLVEDTNIIEAKVREAVLGSRRVMVGTEVDDPLVRTMVGSSGDGERRTGRPLGHSQ